MHPESGTIVLAHNLKAKFGAGYLPHKLVEEMLELGHALHKVLGEHYRYSRPSSEEKIEEWSNMLEEVAHVEVFLALFKSLFLSDLETIENHKKERIERLNLKL